MTELARYGTASPRTAELPRAFTGGEFLRGAGLAWLWFQPLVVIATAVGTSLDGGADIGFSLLVPVFGLPTSVAATILGLPLAYAIGFALRRQRRDAAHLAAFALYGALVGTVVVAFWIDYGFDGDFTLPWDIELTYAMPSALAVVLGWWTTSRLALRKDRLSSLTHGA